MITTKGPIIIIDDDDDDQEILRHLIREMGVTNEIICFSTCSQAFDYLEDEKNYVQPFVILSDVNLPKMNGVELKQRIDGNERLRKKSIPFIFLSTAFDKTILEKVYEYRVQGYFVKGSTMNSLKETLATIFKYWTMSKHPNSI